MKLSNEAKIGILVTAVTIALLALTFRVGDFHFTKKGYFVTVQFHRIEGLEKSAPVRLNGLEVGDVRQIEVAYEPQAVMKVRVWLEERVKLRGGAKAYVKNLGLLGEKYLELTDGEKDAGLLAADAVIVGEEPIDFEKVLAKADVIADHLKSISANINERLSVNSQAIDEIVSNLNSTTSNLEEFSADIKLNPWKLLYKEKKPAKKE